MQRNTPGYNDITLRSQQFGAEVQGAADARIQRSQEIMGQSFQNLGENVQQNVWRNRQMQQDQLRFQQEFDAEQQRFNMGFALQKADADMRLQLQAQEQQLNSYKLQQMVALDAVDMSQIQKDRERMTNEDMRLSIDLKRKQMEEYSGLGTQQKIANIFGKLDPYYITALGYKADPNTGALVPFADEDEKKAMQLALQRRPTRMEDPSMIERRETMSVVALSKQIAELRSSLADVAMDWTPEQKEQIEAEIGMLTRQRALMGIQSNPANPGGQQPSDVSDPSTPSPKPAPAPAPEAVSYTKPLVGQPVPYKAGDQEKIAQWSQMVGIRDTRDPNTSGGEMSEMLDPATRQKVATFIFDNQDNLYKAYQNGAAKGREDRISDKETYLQNVVNSLGNAPSQYTRNVLAVLYKANVLTAEQAQAMGLQ